MSLHQDKLSPLDRAALDYLEARERRDAPGLLTSLQRASALAPGSIWSRNLGMQLVREDRWSDAAVAYEQIDRKYGWTRNWFPFWHGYLEVLHIVDHRRELEVAREARVALPKEVELVQREARALIALGRRAEVRKVIAEMRAFPDTGHKMGTLLSRLGAELWSRGDTLYARQLFDEAIAWFRALPRDVASRPNQRWELAFVLKFSGHCAEALPLFERGVEEDPRSWGNLRAVAACSVLLGNRARAEAIASRLVAAADSDELNLQRAAGIAAMLGERARAVQLLKAFKDSGRYWLSRHLLSLSLEFDSLNGYAPYIAITVPGY